MEPYETSVQIGTALRYILIFCLGYWLVTRKKKKKS